MEASAVISKCGKYRYILWRRWEPKGTICSFICLNPSIADATIDDPTLRRCMGFAKLWGFGAVYIGNLFSLRSTSPTMLKTADDPVGPENDNYLRQMMTNATIVVAAWGANQMAIDRAYTVLKLSPKLWCLGITKSGQPRHPLYVRADMKLKIFRD